MTRLQLSAVLFWLGLSVLLVFGMARPAFANIDEARDVAERLVEDAHSALADPGLAQAVRNERLKEAIAETFNFEIWEQFILRDREEALTEAQRAEFRALLPGYMAELYRQQFGQGLEAEPVIKDVRRVRGDFLVRAEIPRARGKPYLVDWRIRDFGEQGYSVADVLLGGVSFLLLRRDEFVSVMDRHGPAALLQAMRERSL